MKRCFNVGVVLLASAAVIQASLAVTAQGRSISALEQSYLQKAIEGQQAEVALGQLAVQKASSDQVKQYGARMIQDHQRTSEKLQKLMSQEGAREIGELSMAHQQIQRMLSELSGKDFDRAYMAFMVRDHTTDLDEWQQRAQTVPDAGIDHWMAALLPVLKNHLEEARAIAAAIGVTAGDRAKVEEATSPSHPLRSR